MKAVQGAKINVSKIKPLMFARFGRTLQELEEELHLKMALEVASGKAANETEGQSGGSASSSSGTSGSSGASSGATSRGSNPGSAPASSGSVLGRLQSDRLKSNIGLQQIPEDAELDDDDEFDKKVSAFTASSSSSVIPANPPNPKAQAKVQVKKSTLNAKSQNVKDQLKDLSIRVKCRAFKRHRLQLEQEIWEIPAECTKDGRVHTLAVRGPKRQLQLFLSASVNKRDDVLDE